eukprot:1288627-Heterocapsa_arctica.AAC.1
MSLDCLDRDDPVTAAGLRRRLTAECAQRLGGVQLPCLVTLGGPVRSSWKNLPMIAIMARRPFAISAASILVFAA